MDLTNTSITVAALTIALGLVELLKHFIAKRNGSCLKTIVCPNKVEGLKEAIDSIKESTRDTADIVKRNQEGIYDLVEDHSANPEGVKTWKFQGRHVELWEKSVTQQQVMTACLSNISNRSDRLEELQQKMVTLQEDTMRILNEGMRILKQNGGKT